ncbi:MAG TPA: DinB family protein [Bryobacteraceae bacterium]|jgi:hypothetical protein
MNAESLRIADQLRRAFAGDAWHGDPLSKLLDGVTAAQAMERPLASGHTIWELVLHIDVYVRLALGAIEGVAMPKLYGTGNDWSTVEDTGDGAWAAAKKRMFDGAGQLSQAIAKFADNRLQDTVPGRQYDFYYLFHGIVQHSLYHGGQIAMLKRAV